MLKTATLLTIACFLLAFCASCSTYTTRTAHTTTNQQAAIVQACTETANNYPYSRDRLLYKEYGELFTEDAVFQVEGSNKAVGRQAIINALKARGPQKVTRHINNVVDMTVLDNGQIQGVSYVEVWSVDAETYSQGDISVSAPWVIAEYHDQFEMQNGRCLISNRFAKIVYKTK